MKTSSLTIVGTGIQPIGHLTLAARGWIEQSDKVLFAVADPATAEWLRSLNRNAEALPYNTHHSRRREIYREMVEAILKELRRGLQVCAVFYGHPGVFADPAHAALQQARKEGYIAQMLPGISAADCLYADLGLDPGRNGCQSFEVTDFLIRRRNFDPTSALILWQLGQIGHLRAYDSRSQQEKNKPLSVLAEVLCSYYGNEHKAIIYEAAVYYPLCQPVIQEVILSQLPEAKTSEVSTLYVPPKTVAEIDREMVVRLGMEELIRTG